MSSVVYPYGGRKRAALLLCYGLLLWISPALLSAVDGSLLSTLETGLPPAGSPALLPSGIVVLGLQPSATGSARSAGLFTIGNGSLGTLLGTPSFAPRSPLVTADGTVLANQSNAHLIHVVGTGSVLWDLDTSEAPMASAQALDGSFACVLDNGSLLSCTPTPGNRLWSLALGDWAGAPPSIGPDGSIVAGDWKGLLHSFDPHGTERWRTDLGSPVTAQATITHANQIYVGTQSGSIAALRGSDGKLLWSYDSGGTITANPVLGVDGTIYVGSMEDSLRPNNGFGYFHALAPDGTLRWRIAIPQGVAAGAAVLAGNGGIVIPCCDGLVRCVRTDGSRLWLYDTGSCVATSPLPTPAGKLYVLSSDGRVHILSAPDAEAASDWPLAAANARRSGRSLAASAYAGFTKQPDSIQLSSGSHLVLQAGTSGDNLSYQWYRNGIAVPGATSPSYLVEHLDATNAGTYELVASNTLGSVSSNPAVVRIGGSAGARLTNLSSRGLALPGDQILTAGFVIGGTQARSILLRAIGPGLAPFGVSHYLPNPRIRIFSGQTQILSNDDWGTQGSPGLIAKTAECVGAFALTPGSRDASLLGSLSPGPYTLQVSDEADAEGVAIVELYEVDSSPDAHLTNISTRGMVRSGEEILIAGFAVTDGPCTVLIRGVGPTLGSFGVSGALADPHLRVITQAGVELEAADDWGSLSTSPDIAAAVSKTGAFVLPDGSHDAAILLRLNPGTYTAQLSSRSGKSGTGLIEVYVVE